MNKKQIVLKEMREAYADCNPSFSNLSDEGYRKAVWKSYDVRKLRFKSSESLFPQDAFDVMSTVCESYNNFDPK
ncbi:MAG: hypothetical protein EKK64_02025 [Neisseriaceae bacterium]|nr:MAG: hypothetical protein EKK64_02025 [Neisseriaceae bacterium]